MKFWTGVVTEKVQESRDFYVGLFGCNVIYEGEGGWFVLLGLGESELGFMRPGLEFQAPAFRAAFPGQGMWITLDVDDVDAQHQRIRTMGIPIEAPIRDEAWGDRHFVVLDPNGIPVDLVQRRPDS